MHGTGPHYTVANIPSIRPSESVIEALKILSAEPARHLCICIMNAQARYIWYSANPSPESERLYWTLPVAGNYATLMYTDDRCHYEPGEGDEVVVSAPVLWALMSTVWGLRTKLAAKGVNNMRLCSVQHRVWTTHRRLGSLPGVGLRRVTPPPPFWCRTVLCDNQQW